MRVALVGGSPSTQMMTPFSDESYEIWVLGNQLQHYQGKRVTRIFEVHDNLDEHDPQYAEWLVAHNIPMIVGDKFPVEADHVQRFNKSQAKEHLNFFSSSMAYMMAQAIMEGTDHIAIYGVDMAVDNHEYFKQRPAMHAWIAYAKGLGIKVDIPDESSLFKENYDEGTDYNVDKGPFTESEFMKLAEMHQQKCDEYKMLLHSHDGARQAYERLAKAARGIASGADIKTLTETVKIP